MEITRTRIETSAVKRADRATRTGGKGFATSEVGDTQASTGLTGSGPVAAVETLLALQGIDDTADQRSRVLRKPTNCCICWTKSVTGCSQAEFRGGR